MNATKLAPTAPLVVALDTVLCDGAAHEITIVSDGTTAYAFGEQADAGTGCRTLTEIKVACNQPVGHDENPCDGYATLDLAKPGIWVRTTDRPDATDWLLSYGVKVEA